jgi:hypothetical protein
MRYAKDSVECGRVVVIEAWIQNRTVNDYVPLLGINFTFNH